MRLPILFIVVTVTLDAMGIGLILPIMPDLIREVQGGSLANAALWGGVLSTVFAVMQFLFSPVLGSLSDAYGRRPVLLVSLFVMALDYLVMALAGSIWLLLVGRLVGGITAATHATASAYMADISAPQDKARNFGLIGAGFGIGFVLGPLIGGLLGEMGTRAPFYAAALLSGVNFLFGLLILRETVTDRIRRPFSWANANPFGAFKLIAQLPGIGALLLVYFLYSVAHHVWPAVWAFFTVERFAWSPQLIGLSLGIYGVCSALVQGVLIRPVLRRVGERGTVIWSMGFDAVTFVLLAFISSGLLALGLTPVAALGSALMPALMGILSQSVSDDRQGALQGVLGSLTALAMVISPMLMTGVFAGFTGAHAPLYLPGAPFLVSLALVLAALLLFLRASRRPA